MSDSCRLNDDIWHYVLRFLSAEDLQRANSCHHVLFDGWMRSRYTHVKFTHRDKSIRLLEHLSNPNIAAYVKKVEIRPWLVQLPPRHESSSTRFSGLIQSYHTRQSPEERLHRRVNEDVSRLTSAFEQMQNVKEYTIDWDESFYYHAELYMACLTSGLDAWSDGLVKLTVKVPPAMLNSFAGIHLPNLKHFTCELCTGMLTFKEINVATDGFMVFLNNLKDSLHYLHLSSTHSSQNLDFSRIFRKLGRFPLLSAISLFIPNQKEHLSDPATFVRFLEKHRSTLEEIGLLSSQFSCSNQKEGYGPATDQRSKRLRARDSTSMKLLSTSFSILGRLRDRHRLTLKDSMNLFSSRASFRSEDDTHWSLRVAGVISAPFPRLRELGISLSPPDAPYDNLIKLIHKHGSTLDSLTLTTSVLSHNDVITLFRGCALLLSKLHIKIDILSLSFLADLAFLLPELKTLRVECDSAPDSIVNLVENEVSWWGWGLQCLEISTPDCHSDNALTLTIDLSEGASSRSLSFPSQRHFADKSPGCSLSSFVTANDSLSLSLSSLKSRSMRSDVSVQCSIASSRTNDTDYGRFYTRRAFSQGSSIWDGER